MNEVLDHGLDETNMELEMTLSHLKICCKKRFPYMF